MVITRGPILGLALSKLRLGRVAKGREALTLHLVWMWRLGPRKE